MGEIRASIAAVLIALTAVAAGAQAPPPPPADTRRDVVRLYLVQRMRESLALSDAQTLKAMELMEAIDRERRSGQAEQRAILESIRKALEDPATSEDRLAELVADFQKRQARTDAALKDLDAKLLGALTPRQKAQYLVLRRQIMEEIREEGLRPKGDRPERPRNR